MSINWATGAGAEEKSQGRVSLGIRAQKWPFWTGAVRVKGVRNGWQIGKYLRLLWSNSMKTGWNWRNLLLFLCEVKALTLLNSNGGEGVSGTYQVSWLYVPSQIWVLRGSPNPLKKPPCLRNHVDKIFSIKSFTRCHLKGSKCLKMTMLLISMVWEDGLCISRYKNRLV